MFSLHGTPGSRLGRHPDEAMYERLEMHLVTYDRPGYGGSDRLRGRRVPVAPYEALGDQWLSGQAPANVREVSAALAGEDALIEHLSGEVEKIRNDALSVLDFDEDLHASDRAVMESEEVQRVFREMLAEAIRQGQLGWVDDDFAILNPWGFDASSIRSPVVLAYGENDTLAPRAHGEYLARTIPGGEVRIMDSGHLASMEHDEENWARVLQIATR